MKASFITKGCYLAKIPNETVEERRRTYYRAKSLKKPLTALDNTMFNESRGDSRYVKYDPQRDSNVTFGRKIRGTENGEQRRCFWNEADSV